MDNIESRVIENSEYLMYKISSHQDLILLSNQQAKFKSGIVLFKHSTIENNKLYKYLQDNNVVCALRGGGIRFSPHFYHSQEELQQALELIDLI
jgi:selenocysteine lyase/cysteine desulfurase